MYYVYVLKSKRDGSYYKGMTDNLERRLKQHENGNCRSTFRKLPVSLVHVELCQDRQEARKMERYFKSGFGREIIKYIDR